MSVANERDTYPCQKCGRDRREVDGGDFDENDKICVDCDADERDASVIE